MKRLNINLRLWQNA